MKDGQIIFTIFYGLYFAATLTLTRIFQPFDTPSMYKWKFVAWFRFLVSFLLLNILPLLYFVIVFCSLGKIDSFNPGFWPMLALLMFSLAGFGFYRIYFGIMLIKYGNKYLFYGESLPEQLSMALEQRATSLSKAHKKWLAHLIPGIIWVIICTVWGYWWIFTKI